MGRHWYTARSYRDRLDWLAERLPVFGLGADVIAGFPGESDADHRTTMELIERLPFTYLHVFPFSVRPDAPAARLRDTVPVTAIQERARELRELGETKHAAHQTARRGARADGVVSGHQGGRLDVLTEDYLSVYFPVEQWDGSPRFPIMVE
jgi:threonylcarbamoyladenosine tRNA methylthiotransferase MtaB